MKLRWLTRTIKKEVTDRITGEINTVESKETVLQSFILVDPAQNAAVDAFRMSAPVATYQWVDVPTVEAKS